MNIDEYDVQRHKSLPKQFLSSVKPPPISEYEALNPVRVLNPFEKSESWDPTGNSIDDEQLIGPAIIATCPLHVLSMLVNEKESASHNSSPHPFGTVILGKAMVALFTPFSMEEYTSGWTNAFFVLRQNYLLEYSYDSNYTEEKPIGYAHLQYSTVSTDPGFPNTFELKIYNADSGPKYKKMVSFKKKASTAGVL